MKGQNITKINIDFISYFLLLQNGFKKILMGNNIILWACSSYLSGLFPQSPVND